MDKDKTPNEHLNYIFGKLLHNHGGKKLINIEIQCIENLNVRDKYRLKKKLHDLLDAYRQGEGIVVPPESEGENYESDN